MLLIVFLSSELIHTVSQLIILSVSIITVYLYAHHITNYIQSICVLPAVVYSRKYTFSRIPNLLQTNFYDNNYINEENTKKIVFKKSSDLMEIGIQNTHMETRVNGVFNALPKFDNSIYSSYLKTFII